jgi:hypothetical protein
MTERQLGIVVVGDTVTVVDAIVPDDAAKPIEINGDTNWTLQVGDRPAAYDVLSRRCVNFLRENGIRRVLVKASATTRGSATIALLQSAEVRGVVIAAAASVALVRTLAKNHISRNYGDRNVDEYLRDDAFWAAQTTGGRLRKTSREAAMIIIAARG